MWFTRSMASAALAATAAAQFATYQSSGRAISVNIPSGTASSKSGPIYFQISAPSGTQWIGFGQGSEMVGSSMFLVYASGSNVVISPRKATSYSMPTYQSDIKVTLLSGSGVTSDGTMVANVRCDNCLTNMDPTSTSAKWIMAYKNGSPLGSSDQSATIVQHDAHSNFNLDLTTGTGGSSSNPFVAAAVSSSSAQASSTATGGNTASTSASSNPSGTTGVTSPVASSNPGTSSAPSGSTTSSDEESSGNSPSQSPYIHGIIMSVVMVGIFPLGALTVYLPLNNKVRYIHAPSQALGVILLIVGMALGIIWGQKIDELDEYHQIIGYIVVAIMILFQPALGIYQHLHYGKTGGRHVAGIIHQWLGRAAIALGIINGGLGWNLTETKSAYAPYGALAAVMAVIYIGVVVFSKMRARGKAGYPNNKEIDNRNGYEMRTSKEVPASAHEFR